jgi:hypothetical protein
VAERSSSVQEMTKIALVETRGIPPVASLYRTEQRWQQTIARRNGMRRSHTDTSS